MEKIISGLFSGNSGYQLVIQQRRCYGHWVCGSFKYRLFLKRNPTFFKWLLTILSVKYTNCHPSWMKISSPNYFLKFSWASIKPHCLIPLQINVIIFLTNLSNTESGVHVRICDILNGWGWLGFFFFPVKKKSPCLNSMVFCWKVFFFFSFLFLPLSCRCMSSHHKLAKHILFVNQATTYLTAASHKLAVPAAMGSDSSGEDTTGCLYRW